MTEFNNPNITFEEYQLLTRVTDRDFEEDYYYLLKLAGEVGEVTEYVGKCMRKGVEPDSETLGKELMDVMWYAVRLLDRNGLDVADMVNDNLNKTFKRHSEGYYQEADNA